MFKSLLLGRLANRLAGSTFYTTPTFSRVVAQSAHRTFVTTPRLGLPIKVNAAKPDAVKPKAAKGTKPTAESEKKTPKKRVVAGKKPVKKPKKKPTVASKKPAKSEITPVLTITSEMKPPKRGPTSYLLFFQRFLAQHPKVQSIEEMSRFTKTVGQAWHALSDAEKQPYVEQAARQNLVYERERAEWFAHVDPAVLRELDKRQKAKGKPKLTRPRDPTKSKVPLSGYMTFAMEFRRTVEPGVPMIEVARQTGAAWNALPVSERAEYNRSAMESRAQWEAEHKSESQ
ncbi:hypothetical protein BD779DRAFT_1473802 [Infundibulicybe gibba]|nr:hypothetical protein BD779DRAFT_1473802 [Infundibulicybe gibba]